MRQVLIAFGWLAVSALPVLAAQAQLPAVDLADGKLLVQLARDTMKEYLLHRTPASGQMVPLNMQRLKDRNYRVAVTLRSAGQAVGQAVRGDSNMPRNVMSAATAAMRSPLLPDKITAAVLDGLTVEVEVLGEPIELAQQEIADAYIPGWVGLGAKDSQADVVLPSFGYEFGLDAARMQAQVSQARPAASTYQIFTSQHFVGYPDSTTVWLYRGKILPRDETVNDAALQTACRVVSGYLLAQQDPKTGRFCAGGEMGLLVDHLHAAYALARLAQHSGQQADLTTAMAWAQKEMFPDADAKSPHTGKPADQMPAAGYYILACQTAIGKPDATAEKLLQFLTGQLENYVQDKLDRPLTGKEIALGVLALRSAGRLDAKLEQALIERLNRPSSLDDQSQLWLLWAHLPSKAEIPDLSPSQPASTTTRLLDERGGWPLVGEPATQTTAIWADILAAQLSDARANKQQAQVSLLSERLFMAKQFCRMMMFKRYEDYFASPDAPLPGSVRDRPGCAQVSLRSCAAAIEAMLAK
jgi:hypothetical protein